MMISRPQASRRIGFVSTRFKGNDGVSLESEKWAEVFERLGHSCFYFSGESDRPNGVNHIDPEAHFEHPEIKRIHDTSFSEVIRPPELTRAIHEMTNLLKEKLYAFVGEFNIQLLVVQNALSIPMNLPLGMALTEFIAETGIITIAHHHDFFWERQRFLVNCVTDYLDMAFPPQLSTMRHVVINTAAASQLSLRMRISGIIIPNVMDFENPPDEPDAYGRDVRAALGLDPDEHFFLQPTRVVPRKRIERAIELISRLGRKASLVISHTAGDEGFAYEEYLRRYAELLHARVIFVSDIIHERRGALPDGRKVYSLWDVYPRADIVTYPSDIEGFGNAFLEALYYRRPIVVNNYSIFDTDIKPKGFRVIEFRQFIDADTVELTREVLDNPDLAAEMAETNYQLAKRHYSYATLERHLQTIISECFGEDHP